MSARWQATNFHLAHITFTVMAMFEKRPEL